MDINLDTKAVKTQKIHSKMNGFDRSCRLVSSADFSYVFSKPTKVADNCFVILASSSSCQRSRLGLAVAKKQAKLAVQRNRLKRLIRESFRNYHFSHKPMDCVVLIKHQTQKVDNQSLFKKLDKLWLKLEQRFNQDG